MNQPSKPSLRAATHLRPVCPRCGHELCRIPRQPFDLLIDSFITVWRFRCGDDACTWEGLRRQRMVAELEARQYFL